MASEMMDEVRLEASEATELAAEVTSEAAEEAADEAASPADEAALLAPLLSPEAEGLTAEALATAEVRMGRASGVVEALAATPAQRA